MEKIPNHESSTIYNDPPPFRPVRASTRNDLRVFQTPVKRTLRSTPSNRTIRR